MRGGGNEITSPGVIKIMPITTNTANHVYNLYEVKNYIKALLVCPIIYAIYVLLNAFHLLTTCFKSVPGNYLLHGVICTNERKNLTLASKKHGLFAICFSKYAEIYSQTSMARTPLEP